ncbi:MAG: tail fiber domain-containing protein [Clostridia bacterium]|nr:tail fiber domain-containing protein [Clostridia bacterium]
MNLNIAYPSISEGTTEERLNELRSYLYQMVDTLNACDTSAYAVMSELSQAVNASELPEDAKRPETELRLQEYSALRSLIIKTADYAVQNSESFGLSLQGNYVAVSDFGEYFENATVDIDGTPYGITQLYNYSAGIDAASSDYRVNQESYIKTGLLYHDGALPVYGVGVGNIYGDFSVYEETEDTEINNAKTYYTKNGSNYVEVSEPTKEDLTTYFERVLSRQGAQLYSTFTADEMAFWSGSTKLAYMNTGAVYFPNAHLTGGSIQIGGTDANPTFSVNSSGYMKATSGKIANWNIGTDNLYTDGATFSGTTGMYFGSSGLRIGKNFKVDSDGKMTATSGSFSGSLNAATGTFAGSLSAAKGTFAGELSAATGSFAGTLSAGVSINSPNITGGTLSGITISGNDVIVKGHLLIYNGYSYLGNIGYGTSGTSSGPGLFTNYSSVVATDNGPSMKYLGGGEVTAYYSGALIKYGDYSSVTCGASGTHLVGDSITANGSPVATNSDRNVKHEISYDLDEYEEIYNGLLPAVFKYNFGKSDRKHTGFIAQDVKASVENTGHTTQDLAAYVEFDEPMGIYGECGLRYEEFIALNTWQIQKLKRRVEALEKMIGG